MEYTTEQELRPEEIKALNSWLFVLLREHGPEESSIPNDEGGTSYTWNDVDIVRAMSAVDKELGSAFQQYFYRGRTSSSDIWNDIYRNQPELIMVAVKNGGFTNVESFL